MRRTSPLSVPQVRGSLLTIVAAALVASCASSVALVPLVPHEDGVAEVEQSGVVLRAKAKPGLPQLPPDVIPIRISVENKSEDGIYVDLDDIQLEGTTRTFVLLPAVGLRPRPPVGLTMDPASPYASAQGAAALQYGLPGNGVGAFSMDPALAYSSGDGWRSPASRDLVMSAFNGGFIDAGESQHGLVFFRAASEATGPLTLRVRVHRGSGSAPVETLEIPYTYSVEG